jgi:hypothetical protein
MRRVDVPTPGWGIAGPTREAEREYWFSDEALLCLWATWKWKIVDASRLDAKLDIRWTSHVKR